MVRQNRFAVCLCAVRRWLRCPNCFCIFLRFWFFWIFYVFRMANSRLLVSPRFQYRLINTSVKGNSLSPYLEDALPFCPCGTFPHTVGNHPPPPSWASSTAVACGSGFTASIILPTLSQKFHRYHGLSIDKCGKKAYTIGYYKWELVSATFLEAYLGAVDTGTEWG